MLLLGFLKELILQDLLSSTWMMNEMLRMQLEDLTGQSSVEKGVGFVLNGPRFTFHKCLV